MSLLYLNGRFWIESVAWNLVKLDLSVCEGGMIYVSNEMLSPKRCFADSFMRDLGRSVFGESVLSQIIFPIL